MTNGDQILKSAFVRTFDQCDDVALTLPKNNRAMGQAWTFSP